MNAGETVVEEPPAAFLALSTDAQRDAVTELAGVLQAFHGALVRCGTAGLEPAEAFRACGISIPAMAGPLLNQILT